MGNLSFLSLTQMMIVCIGLKQREVVNTIVHSVVLTTTLSCNCSLLPMSMALLEFGLKIKSFSVKSNCPIQYKVYAFWTMKEIFWFLMLLVSLFWDLAVTGQRFLITMVWHNLKTIHFYKRLLQRKNLSTLMEILFMKKSLFNNIWLIANLLCCSSSIAPNNLQTRERRI